MRRCSQGLKQQFEINFGLWTSSIELLHLMASPCRAPRPWRWGRPPPWTACTAPAPVDQRKHWTNVAAVGLKHRTLKHWTLKHWNIERMLLQIWCWFISLFSPLPAQSLCCPQSQLPRASSDLEDWTRLKVVVNGPPHLQDESSHQFEVHWQNTPWLNHWSWWHACISISAFIL